MILRFIYLFQLRATPLFDSPGLDSAYYLDQAKAISAGDWIGHGVFFMGPLYPYFLAIVSLAVGFSTLNLLMVQCLLGSAGVVLLYLLGRRLFDHPTAIAAAAGMATYGMLIQYDNHFLMEWLLTLILLGVLLQLASVGPKQSLLSLVLGGGLLGLAALGRASLLAFAPAALLWLAWGAGAGLRGERGSRLGPPSAGLRRRWILAYAAGLIAVIAPVTLRNAAVGGDRVLITSNGGLNFFIGNNSIGRGTYIPLDEVARAMGVAESNVDVSWMVTDPAGRAVAEAAAGRALRPSEVSNLYGRRAREYMASNPQRAIMILGRKLLLFWNAAEIAQIESPALYRELIPLARAPLLSFGVVGPLALLGLVFALDRERCRRLLLLPLFVVTFTLTVVAFFVTARYRAPVVPVLILLAAFAAIELVRRGRMTIRRHHLRAGLRALANPAILMAGFAAVVHLDLVETNPAGAYINLGIALAEKGRYEEAIAAFRRAVEAAPRDPVSRYNLGAAYLQARKLPEAAATFEDVVTLSPRSVAGWSGLGESLARQGRASAAAPAFRQAAILAGTDPVLWRRVGENELAAGRVDSAVVALSRGLALDPDNAPILKLLQRITSSGGADQESH